ncbi:citrate synthase [Pseudoclavibacter sp. CFCC 14310]|nr:citrate synthase [Pseudoclavibacter sp. CFCC 14310]KAB1657182.1 citrate synthase [Pseudoclavibacter sp. CFCC 11306]KAB1663796.1 citrate synthase [Pseudoclavibacter sp. CFCC 13611]
MKLIHPNGETEFPILETTAGHDAIDFTKLTKNTGLTSFDPGFVNTASTKSNITFIDGDEGILRYRGYPIEQLAEHSSFLEVAWLLIHGELPTPEELTDFEYRVMHHNMLNEDFKRYFDVFPKEAHPMSVLASAVSALSTFYQDSLDTQDAYQVKVSSVRLLAKMPVLAAYALKRSLGQPLMYPDNKLGYVDNFLRLTFGMPTEEYEVNPVVSRALERLLILHADHEQNASTSTVRLVGSTQANIFASVSSGINALFGPLHGGANEAVLTMLEQIRESGMSVGDFVEKVKNKESGIRLMGFGHRVYKNYDPRAKIVKASAESVLNELGVHDPLLEIATELEEIALKDDYFQSRRLYPNIDFYTGVIYKAMGFPTKFFTVLFAIGRLPGWIAQWREQNDDPTTKIGRPHQLYMGNVERNYPGI